MKREDVTEKQFAIWSFERDQKVGLYKKSLKFEGLPQDEQDSYLEEARYYMSEGQDDWPEDILERLQ